MNVPKKSTRVKNVHPIVTLGAKGKLKKRLSCSDEVKISLEEVKGENGWKGHGQRQEEHS